MSTVSDREHLDNFNRLRDHLMSALAEGESTVSIELSVLGWLAIVDEIQDRRPRNMSSLIRDDTMARLDAAIERLTEETKFLIAYGPADVSARCNQ